MELKDYIRPLLKWWWLVVLATTVAAFSSILVTRQQPFIYAAKATLMVGRSIENPNPTGMDVQLSQQLGQTYADLATRRPVREAVQAALGLQSLPGYSARLVPNTQLLEIRVTDTDPLRAQAVANEVARQLIEQTPAEERSLAERRQYLNSKLKGFEDSMDATDVRIEELRTQLAGMFSARQIADTQSQITALEQKRDSYGAGYMEALAFLKGGTNTLQTVESADLPTAPVGPNKRMTILLAAAIGFALAVAAAYLLEYLDDTLKSPDDVKKATGMSTLGSIMRIEEGQSDSRLITFLRPDSPAAEAYRVLRTNIQFSALDDPPRTLVVTSPHPLEGKSTTLANLAVVMAQQGQRVVLVDTDLRRPMQHRIFRVPNHAGLTNALLQEPPTVAGFLRETSQENLRLLTTGPLPPYPSELLGSRRLAALLEEIKREADIVLFDSPPILVVTDAVILARQVDGVLLVVDAGGTRRQSAVAAKEALERVGARILGVALNRLKTAGNGYSYYYSSGDEGPRKPRRRLSEAPTQATEAEATP